MAAPGGLELIACCKFEASDVLLAHVTLIVATTAGDRVLTLGWLIALFVAVELQAAATAIERTTAAG
jgi:hypothetical protein